jgi:glucose-1-phosphate adenylyltransferase
MPDMRDAIGVLLAGGQGERLWPLTRDRAKPAVPFGALYRIIDITLPIALIRICGAYLY